MSSCTITGDSAGVRGGGGGVENRGTLTMSGCTVTGDSAGTGGGVDNGGTLTMSGCTVTGDSSVQGGGGVANGGTLTMSGCTVAGDSADSTGFVTYAGGGGVYNGGTLTMSGCTVTGDSALSGGGGVDNASRATLTLSGCTVAGDSARDGGGVYNKGGLTLSGCTVTGDSAGFGGGLFNFSTGTVTLNSTIVANSLGGGDIVNEHVLTGSHDLIGDGSGAIVGTGNLLGTVANPINPLLAPLGDYGGPTQTMALLPGSPAIDQGGAVAVLTAAGVADTMTTAVTLASGSAFAATNLPALAAGDYFVIQVDSELMAVTALTLNADGTATLTVHRAADGTKGAIHAGGAPVLLASDQRGELIASGGVDIGAFQSQGFTLTPVAGSTPQNATSGTAFANPLSVTVTANNSLEPVAAGVIDFSAPTSGASAALSGGTVTIGTNGVASITATANAVAGSYSVIASASGVAAPAFFLLTNVTATTPPTSHVVNSLGTSQTSDTFSVSVTFSDPAGPGSAPAPGVSAVELWVSVNNGAFTLSQTMNITPADSGTVTFSFTGQDRNIYAFHSITIDAAGNTESKNSNTIEASTSVPDSAIRP